MIRKEVTAMDTNRIPCIYLSNGNLMRGFEGVHKKNSLNKDAKEYAKSLRDAGANGAVVFDFSSEDAEHEVDLETLREICKEAVVPVIGAGNVKRVEDIKKLIYAGCEKAVLNFAKEADIVMLEEVSKRFGKERIAVYLPSAKALAEHQKDLEEFSSLLICDASIAAELSAATSLGVLAHEDSAMECEALGYETGFISAFTFEELKKDAAGLVPCVVQDAMNDEVLMVAYMNEESLNETLRTRRMTYWSRSRQELWQKGATSGHYQFLKELRVDCDNDTLLAKVVQLGAACHTGNRSCFYRKMVDADASKKNLNAVLDDVYGVITDRKIHPKEGSYTNYLFDKGIDKILKKIGEEATEIVIAAKNPDKQEVIYEMSDFLYHMMVLMAERGITWEELLGELANR
jgi:phosphoribosyl-ATP pyrophosphohydrolase/phosphoribosyl-AMP cyclohydrolase